MTAKVYRTPTEIRMAALERALEAAIPELERLIEIIEGRHQAQLVGPHGQSSAGPRRALELARQLSGDPRQASE